MDRDDCKVRGQRIGPIGPFCNRQPQQDRVRKQPAKANRDTVFDVPFKDMPRPKVTGAEPGQRTCVKGKQQRQIKARLQIKGRSLG